MRAGCIAEHEASSKSLIKRDSFFKKRQKWNDSTSRLFRVNAHNVEKAPASCLPLALKVLPHERHAAGFHFHRRPASRRMLIPITCCRFKGGRGKEKGSCAESVRDFTWEVLFVILVIIIIFRHSIPEQRSNGEDPLSKLCFCLILVV